MSRVRHVSLPDYGTAGAKVEAFGVPGHVIDPETYPMTESEWLACNDPGRMLEWAQTEPKKFGLWAISDRKLRLFACACWRLMFDSEADRRHAEDGEVLADGERVKYRGETWLTCRSALDTARWAIEKADSVRPVTQAALLRDIVGNPFRPITRNSEGHPDGAGWWQAGDDGLEHEIMPEDVLIWDDGCVRKMATVCYDERAFDQLPILADALTDAGCDDQGVLRHLRQTTVKVQRRVKTGGRCPKCDKSGRWRSGVGFEHEKICMGCDVVWEPGGTVAIEDEIPATHFRGCWVLDLLLGKE